MNSHVYFGIMAKMEEHKKKLTEENYSFSNYMENGNICIVSHRPKIDILHYCFDPKKKIKHIIIPKESKISLSKSHIYVARKYLLSVISEKEFVTCGLPENETFEDMKYYNNQVIIITSNGKYTYDEKSHNLI